MQKSAFIECGATQEKSVGWVPPRGQQHDPLIAVLRGATFDHKILCLMIETKRVPGEAIKRKVDEQCKAIEQSTGRKPGKKERREIMEDARLSLLPMAFTSRKKVYVWINRSAGYIVIDSTSQSVIDDVTYRLIGDSEDLSIMQMSTFKTPASLMTGWLGSGEGGVLFSIERACELKAQDETKAVVRYKNHPLDTPEVMDHIKAGKLPTKLALTFGDRVSFTLTENMQLKGITFLDVVFQDKAAGNQDDVFDSEVFITTSELDALIFALKVELGGEMPLYE
ncbi:recombination-associated protein RdgC [Rhodoferax mekongensis]|uniref:Recombination-associated protein RdgC n=1 Tax=Rhodoferax mekongensis TaxID=3068341 RepID=A0ABZ0B3M9_9BURK|nr:recombination-associated protein RdgC [Rhodoferax sp. TBRC 17307]WNO05971.1 recombination-associated protein RdgC [Rhodoferax sp. TBRC 17307]